jgi:hypothetical protein
MTEQPVKKTRAEINRENAQKSTGPKTDEGKAASSKNAFKHGIYSDEVVIPGEDVVRYEELLADLRGEHEPATPSKEILVNEMAQHYWHIRHWRKMETQMYIAQGPGASGKQPLDMAHLLKYVNTGLFAVLHRSLASVERNFHRALSSLLRLKKQNGFVPSEPRASSIISPDGFVPAEARASEGGIASFDKSCPISCRRHRLRPPEPPVSASSLIFE